MDVDMFLKMGVDFGEENRSESIIENRASLQAHVPDGFGLFGSSFVTLTYHHLEYESTYLCLESFGAHRAEKNQVRKQRF